MSYHHLLLLLRPSRRQVYLVGLGLGTTTLFTTTVLQSTRHRQPPLLCESSSSSSSSSSTVSKPLQKHQSEQSPRWGSLEQANLWKEISSGSILGLVSGISISMFSKPLSILFGLALLVIQFAASKGINIIPTSMIQKYVKGINIKSLILKEEHPVFKLSFGIAFLLAGWGNF